MVESNGGKKHKGGYRQINKSLNICAFEDYLESQLSHLPEIANVEQISPRVIRVLGQNAGKVSRPALVITAERGASLGYSVLTTCPT